MTPLAKGLTPLVQCFQQALKPKDKHACGDLLVNAPTAPTWFRRDLLVSTSFPVVLTVTVVKESEPLQEFHRRFVVLPDETLNRYVLGTRREKRGSCRQLCF